MTRGTEMTVNLSNGSDPVILRHKHDGCFEIYQYDVMDENPDIIHIEQEDMEHFYEVFKTWYGRIRVMDSEKRIPGLCQYSVNCQRIATETIDTVLGDVEVCQTHKDFYEGMDKPKAINPKAEYKAAHENREVRGQGYHDQN